MERQPGTPEIVNKKAYHDYEILEKYIAGIQLKGTEIKSIRQGKASIKDAFCYFKDGELFVKNMHIAEYDKAGYTTHDPYRDRKLLLRRSELNRLSGKVEEKGLTIVPLRLFITPKGWAKLEIALVRGKKKYDKRETIKKREAQRQMERVLKRYR